MDTSSLNIIFISLWFLLPIAPAYLLFKVLKSSAIVSGPFQGLNTKIGGAFAGYFLLILIALPIMSKVIKNKYENYEVWNVKGRVVDAETGHPVDITKNPRINVQPVKKILPAGNFNLEVIGERKDENFIIFPDIEIEADGYLPQSLGGLDYEVGTTPKKDFCDEFNCGGKKASFQTVKLTRIPVIRPNQTNTVQDDTTTSIAIK